MPSNPESQTQTLAQIRAKLAQSNGTARKRRKLDQTKKNRAEKLKDIAKRLKGGEHVQNRMLKTWLTVEEYATIAMEWELEQNFRQAVFDKPETVKAYEALLKRADFLYNKADARSLKGKQSKPSFHLAEYAYERALEYLEEQFGVDGTLQAWFDRPLDFGLGSLLDTDPDSMPRCVTSRSINRQVGQSHEKRTIGGIKLQVVQQALDDLIFEATEVEGQNQKIKKLMQLPSDDLEF
jgi:hypothetical protein